MNRRNTSVHWPDCAAAESAAVAQQQNQRPLLLMCMCNDENEGASGQNVPHVAARGHIFHLELPSSDFFVEALLN